MERMIFCPNDGRKCINVASLQDIRDYMGDVIDSFKPIEIVGSLVVAYIGGQPIGIGRIKFL